MFAEIKLKLAEGNERTVGLKAHAGIPIRYRNLFHKDLMRDITKYIADGAETDDALGGILDMVPQLAFVMAMSAEGRDMSTLKVEDFITWVEQFSSDTFTEKSGEIISIYFGSAESDSKPKN